MNYNQINLLKWYLLKMKLNELSERGSIKKIILKKEIITYLMNILKIINNKENLKKLLI